MAFEIPMLRLPEPSRSPLDGPSYVHAQVVRRADATDNPRVLAILNTGTGWSRGVLRGFMAAAHEHRWTVLHYPPPADVEALMRKFTPSAILVGPDSGNGPFTRDAPVPIVSVALDLSSQ